MSCEYGVRCKTCGVSSNTPWNHGDHVARMAIRLAPKIKELKTLDDTGYLEIGFLGDYEGVIHFITEHADHEMVVIDEYGRLDGEKTFHGEKI